MFISIQSEVLIISIQNTDLSRLSNSDQGHMKEHVPKQVHINIISSKEYLCLSYHFKFTQ